MYKIEENILDRKHFRLDLLTTEIPSETKLQIAINSNASKQKKVASYRKNIRLFKILHEMTTRMIITR